MQPTIILILMSCLWACAGMFVWALCIAASRPRPSLALDDGLPAWTGGGR